MTHCRPVRFECVCCAVASALLLAWAPQNTRAGDPCPSELVEVANWDQASSYADIWGEGDIVYVGSFGGNTVHFFDISDPANPDRFLAWSVSAPNNGASAQEVKSGDGLLFIGLSGGSDGVEIVDVRDPFNPVHLTWVDTPGFPSVHNLFYDSGYLYLADSGDPEVGIVDLTSFDPDNAPSNITENLWRFNVGSSFVHDMTVVDGRMYACAWNSGLHIFDVTNVANEEPVFLGSGPGESTHAVWPSDNKRWAVVAEERPNGPAKLYEIIDNGEGLDVILRDSLVMPGAFSAHNPLVIGNRAYIAWYAAGVRILDIDEDTASFVEVTSIQFPPGGGFGTWGVYPFLGEDRIVASDNGGGLFVLRNAQTFLSISYPDGPVDFVHPIEGASLTVEIASVCDDPDPNSAKVFLQIEPGDGGFVEIPLLPIGGDLFAAQLPGAPCGSEVQYYVSVDSLGGENVVDPPGAPNSFYTASVVSSIEVFFADNFETNQNWNEIDESCPQDPSTTGQWERVDPNGTTAAPEDDYSGGEGTMCYVTGQGSVGAPAGAEDVDGGPVRLVSPEVVIDGVDVQISYARWFVNNDGSDSLTVEASGNGGATWALVENVPHQGVGWNLHAFQLSDLMTPGETVMVRFSTEDCPNDSITEAAIDEFRVQFVECVDEDVVAPFVVHDDGVSTTPFSGYVDPRAESSNGVDLDLGIDAVTVTFSELVRNVGGAELDETAFSLVSTGGAVPNVFSVFTVANPRILVLFDGNLTPGSWYTLIAEVEDTSSNVIDSVGNQGPGIDEPDRVDIAMLPADVDQSGFVSPVDLLRMRQYLLGVLEPPQGIVEDYADIDRNGFLEPLDLLRFRQLVTGAGFATQSWVGETLDATRP